METLRTSHVTKSRAIVLTLAGIITAILCALALINDSYSTGEDGSRSSRFIKTASVPNFSAFVTPVSKIMENAVLTSINPK